jgi:ketosteroid isomerase-like protein
MNDGLIISDIYTAFGKGDVPTVLGLMDPAMTWDEAEGFMYGGRYFGPNGILEGVFQRLGTEWEGFTVSPEKVVDGGDGTVVVTGRYSGKYLPTEKSMSVPFAHVWTVRDGKTTSFVQYTDTLVIAKQIGLIQ